MDMLEKMFMLGLGVLSLTKEKIDETVEELVERGKVTRSEGSKLAEQIAARGKQEKEALQGLMREEFKRALDASPLATKADIERLEAEIRRTRTTRKAASAGKTVKKTT